MSSVPQFTVTSRNERRDTRGENRRFEDNASSILETHLNRLDGHRRSVMLFYLLFGLLAGFFLGIAGAKGVLAKTVDAQLIEAEIKSELVLTDAAIPSELPMDWDVGAAFGPRPEIRMSATGHAVAKGERFAMLPTSEHNPFFAQAMQSVDEFSAQASRKLKNKELYIGLLALIMAVTGALTFTFWRHLGQAYTPRRRKSSLD